MGVDMEIKQFHRCKDGVVPGENAEHKDISN
jgi:hypothetical protein